jgi:hypothetical protein
MAIYAGIIAKFCSLDIRTHNAGIARVSCDLLKTWFVFGPEIFQSAKKAFVLNFETLKMATDEKTVVLNETAIETASDPGVIQLKPQKKWTSYIWDTFDKSPQERRFLFKVDAAILTFASLGMDLMQPLTFF